MLKTFLMVAGVWATLADEQFGGFTFEALAPARAERPNLFSEVGRKSNHDHLILVPGHAIVDMQHLRFAATNESIWYLFDYQRGQGLPQVIESHIRAGIALAANDSKALMMISGGQTRGDSCPGISEAGSYLHVARHEGWILPNATVVLEEYARDSLENPLFSMCRFHEVVGAYPSKVTIVGFPFKMERFHMHLAAIGFPAENFEYVGVPLPAQFNPEPAVAGEAEVRVAFQADPYGCSADLRGKRDKRNPYNRTPPYAHTCPAMAGLFEWCGPELYKDMDSLPWNGSAKRML